ncbi:MAG: hypothetical protein WC860_06490 [Candidatus Margulisiibacteriota bacterium]|jgi:hypothetical protein
MKYLYSCLIFCEGSLDKNFLIALFDLPQFKYHTQKWYFNYDNATGNSPETILKQCKKAILNREFHLVICLIDLDKLKQDYPKKWKKEQHRLENIYSDFKIIWQIDNAEEEYRKVLGEQYRNKLKLNKLAKQKIREFINSEFWGRLLEPIRSREQELNCS